jgi:hypothetical protein
VSSYPLLPREFPRFYVVMLTNLPSDEKTPADHPASTNPSQTHHLSSEPNLSLKVHHHLEHLSSEPVSLRSPITRRAYLPQSALTHRPQPYHLIRVCHSLICICLIVLGLSPAVTSALNYPGPSQSVTTWDSSNPPHNEQTLCGPSCKQKSLGKVHQSPHHYQIYSHFRINHHQFYRSQPITSVTFRPLQWVTRAIN